MTLRVFTAFEAIPSEIRLQLEFPAIPNYFLSVGWFELLFRTSLQATLAPRIYVLDSAQGVQGALFCGVERQGAAKTLHSLTNFYSLDFVPVIAALADRQQVCSSLAASIAAERPRWTSVRLSVLSTESDDSRAMLRELASHGFSLHRFFQYENWYMHCSGESFDGYYAKRPSQLRNTIARRQKKLEKAHKAEIAVVRDLAPNLDSMVADFIAIYASSWKEPEPFPEFIPAFAQDLARLGILRLGILYVDAVPAAAQLWIVAERKATIYKLAYDEKYAEFGVGSILSRELFRIAMDEDHVAEIDYGVGSEAYKKDWMSAARTIGGVQAFNSRTMPGLLMGATESAKKLVKKWMRKSMG